MSYGIPSKLAAAIGFAMTCVAAAQAAPPESAADNFRFAQYYPDRYDRGWRDRGYREQIDPRFACQQRAGDIFRVPSKEISIGRVREVSRGVFQMQVEGRGRFATCTADARGYVVDFR